MWKHVRYAYYSAKYALVAWLAYRTGWRWLHGAAWDAVEAKHADALDAYSERLLVELHDAPTAQEWLRAKRAP